MDKGCPHHLQLFQTVNQVWTRLGALSVKFVTCPILVVELEHIHLSGRQGNSPRLDVLHIFHLSVVITEYCNLQKCIGIYINSLRRSHHIGSQDPVFFQNHTLEFEAHLVNHPGRSSILRIEYRSRGIDYDFSRISDSGRQLHIELDGSVHFHLIDCEAGGR